MLAKKTNFIIEEKQILNKIEVEEDLKRDIWSYEYTKELRDNLNGNDYYINKNKNQTIDFSSIKNNNIKNEIKYYFIKAIKLKNGCTELNNLRYGVNLIINYISNSDIISCCNSILDYQLEYIVKDFTNWLLEHGNCVKITKIKINKKIQLDCYEYESDVISLIRKIYNFLYEDLVMQYETYFDKDKWIFEDLPYTINIYDCSSNKSINFEKIIQPEIKLIIKKLCDFELKNKPTGSVINTLYNLVTFSKYLVDYYPNVLKIEQIDRKVLDNYIAFLKTNCKYVGKTINSKKRAVEDLLMSTKTFKWTKVNEQCILYKTDSMKTTTKIIEPYTDEELKEINKVLDKMDIQLARLLCVLQYIGIRISEICSLKIIDLRKDANDKYYLHYLQHKTKKYNIIPVSDTVLELLQSAINTSKHYYGENASYIFSLKDIEIITPVHVDRTLKRMSFKYGLIDKSGKSFNITTHRFRATVATKYAEIGIDPVAISRILGQKGLGSLKHYINIHNDEMVDALKPIISNQNLMIENMGNIKEAITSKKTEEQFTPLPNGTCYKPLSSGLCKHANVCYNCKMFRPDISYLNVYKYHLNQAQQNITVAEINGYDRLLQINKELEKSLIKIVNSIVEVKNVQ